MKNKAVFLDRDGTINVDMNYEWGSTYKIEDLEIISGVVEGLKILQKEYKLIVVTNQTTIGRGYCTEKDYFCFRNELLKKLNKQGVFLSAEYFCPHKPEDNCNCRKPRTGMLEEAAKDLNLDLKNCWMIGDKIRDIVAGKNAGCRTIHVLTGPYKEDSSSDFIAKDMIEAAKYILNCDKNK